MARISQQLEFLGRSRAGLAVRSHPIAHVEAAAILVGIFAVFVSYRLSRLVSYLIFVSYHLGRCISYRWRLRPKLVRLMRAVLSPANIAHFHGLGYGLTITYSTE